MSEPYRAKPFVALSCLRIHDGHKTPHYQGGCDYPNEPTVHYEDVERERKEERIEHGKELRMIINNYQKILIIEKKKKAGAGLFEKEHNMKMRHFIEKKAAYSELAKTRKRAEAAEKELSACKAHSEATTLRLRDMTNQASENYLKQQKAEKKLAELEKKVGK